MASSEFMAVGNKKNQQQKKCEYRAVKNHNGQCGADCKQWKGLPEMDSIFGAVGERVG